MPRPRIAPVVWQPPPIPKRSRRARGDVAMPRVRLLDVVGIGPEDVALDSAGRVFTAVEDGRVLRMSQAGDRIDVVANTGGRPLGIEVDRDDTLVVCDAYRGLLRVHPDEDGRLELLVAAGEEIGGKPLRVCNNAAISRDGTIFFSDSSQRFDLSHYEADLLEHSGTGRLLRRDADGGCHLVAEGLHFANGVALAADESFVVVAETGAYRLTRVWLAGERAGEVDLFADNLPAFPDNLSTGSDGLIWIAMAAPRVAVLDLASARHPAFRRLLWALPSKLQPKPADTAWVQAVDASGQVVHDLQDKVSRVSMVTGVRERGGSVWMGTLHGDAVGTFDLPSTAPPG